MIFLDNFCYNVEIAKKLGVSSSVFLSCLFAESKTSEKKEECVSLSREQIFERTGLTTSSQEKVEEFLSTRQMLEVKPFKTNKDKNYYKINYDKISKTIEYTLNTQDLFTFNSTATTIKRETKQEKHINSLKKGIASLNMPSMLQQMFCDWVDSVYASSKGFLTLPSLRASYQDLINYTSDDEVKQKIMTMAIKSGYRDLQWVINSYDRSQTDTKSFNWKSYDSMISDGSEVVNEEF